MKDRRILLVAVALVVIIAAIYLRTAYFPFCEIDDRDYVSENARVAAGLTADSIKWAFTAFHASNWHPVTWLSLMADSQFLGTSPTGYHLVNVALHAAAAVLLFLLFNSMTGALWRSAFVAACFALHPLHVESVAWISERKDVLSAVFWMLTLICYSEYARKSRRGMYVLSLTFFGIGLMAKAMLVTIPVVLLLLDLWPLRRMPAGEGEAASRRGWRKLAVEKVPYLLLALGSSAVTVIAQHNGGAVATLNLYPMPLRITNAVWSLLSYLLKMVFPVNLAIYYPFLPVPLWKAGLALAAVAAVTWLSIRKIREYPWLAAGWLWYLVTLLPVIGIIQVGGQAMADRYTYIPYIGIFAIAGWGIPELLSKAPRSREMLAAAAAAVLVFFGGVSWMQLGYWQDNMGLLSHAMAVTEKNYVAGYALALVYDRKGQKELALEQFQKAINNYPRNPDLHQLHLHVGNILNGLGRSAEALTHFDEAIRLKPEFWQAYYNRGLALENLARSEEALASYQKVLELRPGYAPGHNNIGRILASKGMATAAAEKFSLALREDPSLDSARDNLQALHGKGQKGGQ